MLLVSLFLCESASGRGVVPVGVWAMGAASNAEGYASFRASLSTIKWYSACWGLLLG